MFLFVSLATWDNDWLARDLGDEIFPIYTVRHPDFHIFSRSCPMPYLDFQEISIFSEFLRSSLYISRFCTYKYFLIIFLASLYNRGGGQSRSLLTSGSQEGDVASGYECSICMWLLSFISNGHQCPADQIDISFVLSCCESRCIK